jgi:integral membrane sensor domain MASE1
VTLRQDAPKDAAPGEVTSDSQPDRRPTLRSDAGRVAAVFLAFTALAVMSRELFGSWSGPSFFYPAAGVTAGAMMISRRGLWPYIGAAVAAAEVLIDTAYGTPLWVAGGFAAANVVEPFIGATLVLAWCGRRPDLAIRREFVVLIVGACVIAPAFGALIGGTVTAIRDAMSWHAAVLTWWAGDAVGVLVMASPILLWNNQSAIVGLLTVANFWIDFPPSILILPVLAFAAFRLDMLGASIGGAVAAFLANVMSTRGRGLFFYTDLSSRAQVVLTQIYVAVIVVVAMVIAQEASARAHAVREREAERRERIRLETLSRLGLQLSAALTPQDIGTALQEQVLNEAGAQALYLGLADTDGRTLDWITISAYPPPLVDRYGTAVPLRERTPGTDVIRYGTPIVLRSAAQYAYAYPQLAQWPRRAGAETVVGWPLNSGGETFGVLLLVWSDLQPLDDAQRAYISAVSTMVSQALVRAKVYTDERARAAVLHSVAQPVTPVEVAGLEYRALYRPADAAHGLGGDWYSVMALPNNRTYLAVGDVIGHGLLSVEDMAQLRSAGNAYAHLGMSAGQVLTEMNHFAASQIDGDFATNLIAIYDPEHSSLSYSSAGHPPPLLRRAATGEVILLTGSAGPMLGPFDDTVYVHSTVAIEPGDVLLMYTDGLVEHRDTDLNTGIEHLQRVVEAWPPAALLDCEALARDVAPDTHDDDLCLLVVRFRTGEDSN